MRQRNVNVVQPYEVGNKGGKSLAIIIPAQIVKEYNFNTSTIFALKVDNMQRLILQNVAARADGEKKEQDSTRPSVEPTKRIR